MDLYDCGDDQTCGGACGAGEFVQGLCPEEGCYSTVSIASVSLLEVSYVLRWSDVGRESTVGGGGIPVGLEVKRGREIGRWPLPHTIESQSRSLFATTCGKSTKEAKISACSLEKLTIPFWRHAESVH